MILTDWLKERARRLKRDVTALYYAYRHPDMPLRAKIVVLCTLGYALSPVDLIPDFIPVLGYLDDLIILPALIALSLVLIPDRVMEESRQRAEAEPITLRRNWVAAVLIILFWAAIISVIALSFLKGAHDDR
ncbi:MAG: DUF1232 domain-containing protein [Spirochaetales bacterium]|nr:DUF1232 domain-containing protein [Spirochaetales bacterium]